MTPEEICFQRGHVTNGWTFSTSIYCEDRIIDAECHSIKVMPGCNAVSYACGRCDQFVSEYPDDYRAWIWRSDLCIHDLEEVW